MYTPIVGKRNLCNPDGACAAVYTLGLKRIKKETNGHSEFCGERYVTYDTTQSSSERRKTSNGKAGFTERNRMKEMFENDRLLLDSPTKGRACGKPAAGVLNRFSLTLYGG